MVSLTRFKDGRKKDTLINIENTKHFVVNHVTLDIIEQTYKSSAEYGPEIDEFEVTGLTPIPSLKISAPRVKESPIQMECELYKAIEIGDGFEGSSTIVVGKIVQMHFMKEVYSDGHINSSMINTVSRLGGMGYGSAELKFEINRSEWTEKNW
eukprot:TRINITY_DN6692_c0_g1_i1.p1 TRINITY_DN6692_c0_g1~~TRINITY_DN6692_c0_g1_i1.p1  ORF type:complete len:153 (-),score=25.07 TRINITY_DN6692_c0_g1_i1:45-503(-)